MPCLAMYGMTEMSVMQAFTEHFVALDSYILRHGFVSSTAFPPPLILFPFLQRLLYGSMHLITQPTETSVATFCSRMPLNFRLCAS